MKGRAGHMANTEKEWAPVHEFADFPWVPVVDGDFLVETPETSLRQGNFKHTQLLAGSNLDESMYFIVYYLANFFTKTNFVPDRQTWLKGILDLLPQQMIKNRPALAAILRQYDQKDLPEEQELSSRFMHYWANFAKTGDPNKNEDGTPTKDIWPKYNSESMEYMDMTVASEYPPSRRTGSGPRREYCAFWKSSLPNLMATA
ncbi:hypothetical protein TELCIR_14316, partial [Teladorsagia circumcincta]